MTCLICKSADQRYLYSHAGYRVYRCNECGFQSVAPTPSAQALADYYDRGYAVPLERYARYTDRNNSRIADLERWQPRRGRLLEVGASYGHSLALARARGWRVAGVELSPTAARYAREHFKLDIANCDLLDAPLERGSFDAAILWHVLEHTRGPKEQLLRLAELLRPGGVIGIRVPNIASLGARLAGRFWPWMSPPAHLWFFSPTTLPRLLEACGFEILEIRTMRGDGNNFYQHGIIALGAQISALRRKLQARSRSTSGGAPLAAQSAGPTTAPGSNPPALLGAWIGLLARAQPITDRLARWSGPLIEPLERNGWGDELLCYARRPE